MDINRKSSLILPKEQGNEEVIFSKSIIVVGSNGSGKSRLGTWIETESPQRDKVHRISAQKSLVMPDESKPVSIDIAQNALLYGQPATGDFSSEHKAQGKYDGKPPALAQLDDYSQLMVYLFSEHIEASAKYVAASKEANTRLDPPVTKLDKIKTLWERILPQRELIIGGFNIQTRVKGDESVYQSSEMSDGERVVFYLIGQCLAAPRDGIIIIDEPELHLHKSIQAPLWTAVEALRDDCLFVYLTHDVDFAASQESSKKIWLKGFDGKNWSWEIIEMQGGLPEDLLLEVIGNRKPVAFVEGENGSYDVALYRAILKDFLVIPRGGCSQVIQSVKALRINSQLHHLQVYGIIDRDRRMHTEIRNLERDGIYVLDVAEVENLFCTREMIELVSLRLARNPEEDMAKIAGFMFSRLEQELEGQISLRAASEIKFRLSLFDHKGASGEAAMKAKLQDLLDDVDVGKIYNQSKESFEAVIASRDYEGLLRLFNRKSLALEISKALDLTNGSLPELVIRLAKTDCRDKVTAGLKKYFGNFAQFIQ